MNSWVLLALASAFFSSAASLVEKKVLLKEHALAFSGTLAFLCFIISTPLFLFIRTGDVVGWVSLGVIALTAVLGGFAFLLIARSVRHREISEISPLLAIGPAITALLGFLFIGESLTNLQIVGVAVIVLGVYVLELKERKRWWSPFQSMAKDKYIYLIFLALLLYATTDVLGKIVISKLHPITYLFYYQLFLTIFYAILIIIKRKQFTPYTSVTKSTVVTICCIAVLTLLYRYTHLSAIKITQIGLAIAVYRSSTLMTTIIGGRLYKEEGVARKVFAAVTVIVGVVLIAM